MTITSYRQRRFGGLVEITAESNLSGAIRWHWWVDGQYVGATAGPTRAVYLEPGDLARVVAVDTTNPGFDPYANPPDRYPPRRWVWWIRSLAEDVARYRIEQQAGGGDWIPIGELHHRPDRWSYSLLTGRLADLTDHAWRVIPIDRAGNDGTPRAIDAERVVRIPDPPQFAITFNAGPKTVTFNAA